MRPLILEDFFNFTDLMRITNANDVFSALAAEAEEVKHQREIAIADMQAQLDSIPLEQREARQEVVDRMLRFQKDEQYMVDFGIHALMQTLQCASAQGAREAVYKFLAPIVEMDAQQVAHMPISALAAMCVDIVKQVPVDFFESAQRTDCESRTQSAGGTRTRAGRWRCPFRKRRSC